MPQRHAKPIARRCVSRAGWTMPEAVAALAVTAALLACLALTTREGRRQASLGENFANLKHYAFGTGAYAADHDDRVPTFSWRAGVDYGFGGVAAADHGAASNQAIEIIRRRTGRTDLTPVTWLPHVSNSHLVLVDYLDHELPATFAAAPEDHLRRLWQADPFGLDDLPPNMRPPGEGTRLHRWAYSSSYELGPAFFSPDAQVGNETTIGQAGPHNLYTTGTAPLGLRRLRDVAFPSQKVMFYEPYQRHFGTLHIFFAYADARVPALAADGAARLLRTAQANHGFNPNAPWSASPTFIVYNPDVWEPPAWPYVPGTNLIGRYRWTRSGLRGRDWGGPELPWVP